MKPVKRKSREVIDDKVNLRSDKLEKLAKELEEFVFASGVVLPQHSGTTRVERDLAKDIAELSSFDYKALQMFVTNQELKDLLKRTKR
jgi:hypothetical protein